MATVFQGLKVLDLSEGMAGSVATMVMADNGAEVIKVEPPSGDPNRSLPAWQMWNRAKKSAVISLDTSAGRKTIRDLVKGTDVLVESFRSGIPERLGIGYDALSKINPGLIYASVTAIGAKGAHKGIRPYDSTVMAKTGEYVRGNPGPTNPPTYRVRPLGSWGAANFLVQGVTAALLVRSRTGVGQKVETSLHRGLRAFDSSSASNRQVELGLMTKTLPPGRLTGEGGEINLPYSVVRTKDGQWIQMTNLAARLFPNWVRAMGLDEIYKDPRFKGAPFQFANIEDKKALRRIFIEKTLEKTADEWLDLFKRNDVGGEPILTTQQAMDHPQILHENGVVEIKDPRLGKMLQIGPLIQFSKTTGKVGKPAPRLGAHTKEVVAAAKETEVAKITGGKAKLPKHPFEGMLVLDYGNWLAAPIGSAFTADFGARVIKIEPPVGDEYRVLSRGMSRTFEGKESMVLDLKTKEGQRISHMLIAKADAMMHNLRAGSESLAIDYPTVEKTNPNIFYLYAGSYGSKGPGAGRPAFGPISGAVSGAFYWGLGRDNWPPAADVKLDTDQIIQYGEAFTRAFSGAGSPDITSGVAVGSALAMGLYYRALTGEGQYAESSMLFSNCYCASEDFVRYEGKPDRLEPDGQLRGTHALHRLYEASDGWVFLDCPTSAEWEAFCKAVGRTDLLNNRRYTTHQSRLQNDNLLIGTLSLILREGKADDWETLLVGKDVMCVRADKQRHEDFFLKDPSVVEDGFIVDVEHPVGGNSKRQGPPVVFSKTPARAETSRRFGQDTVKILSELGIGEDEIEDLKKRKIVVGE